MSSLSESSVLAGAAGQSTGYEIDQSIRFNAADSAYLNRTPSSAGNQKTWTLSWWFKRGNLSTYYSFFNRRTGSGGATNVLMYLRTDDTLEFYISNGSTIDNPITTRVFRDTAAWYHCVATLDTTNPLTDERFRVYINGERETLTGDTFLLDTDYLWNDAQQHVIGRQNYFNNYYLDAYMAEIVFIDGTSLNADSFGEYNSSNIWIPKDVSGLTFGTNGFHIDGRDSSDLGDDESGQGNDFATSGLTANDQRTDSPTNNHCVMNPIVGGSATFTNGNSDLSYSASSWTTARGTVAIPNNSGIYYYEAKVISHAIYLSFGWGDANMGPTQNNNPATPKFFVYADYNGKYYSSTDDGTIGDAWDNNDVIGLWYDSGSTSNNLKFYRNGTLQSSGTKSFDFSDVTHVAPVTQFYSSNSVEYRFDSAYWTNAPAGITSLNAITTNNIGS